MRIRSQTEAILVNRVNYAYIPNNDGRMYELGGRDLLP